MGISQNHGIDKIKILRIIYSEIQSVLEIDSIKTWLEPVYHPVGSLISMLYKNWQYSLYMSYIINFLKIVLWLLWRSHQYIQVDSLSGGNQLFPEECPS